MGPWRREFVRYMRQPVGRRRPVWTGPGPALRIPPALLTLAVALIVSAAIITLLENKLRPAVAESAAAQAQNTMTGVVEHAITAGLAARQVSYGDFVAIQRDEGIIVPRGGVALLPGDTLVLGAESMGDDRHIDLKEVVLRRQHPWNGLRIRDLDISRQTIIIMVKRRGRVLIPNGDLTLKEGDRIILYSQSYIRADSTIEV